MWERRLRPICIQIWGIEAPGSSKIPNRTKCNLLTSMSDTPKFPHEKPLYSADVFEQIILVFSKVTAI